MADWKLSDSRAYRHATPEGGAEMVPTDVAGPLTGTQPPALGRRAAPASSLPDLRRRATSSPAPGVRWGRWVAAAVVVLGGLTALGVAAVALVVVLAP